MSFNCVKRKTNLLIWAGLCHSIPIKLKLDTPQNSLAPTPILKIKNNTFNATEKNPEIIIIYKSVIRRNFRMLLII